jgi:sulfite reductase alpha subunit-like flavoprotein
MIQKENAVIYICGDTRVGTEVRDAIMKLAKVHGKMGIFQANVWKKREKG